MNIYDILRQRLQPDTEASAAVAEAERLLASEATMAIYIEPTCPDCGQELQSDAQGRAFCECWAEL